MFICVRQVSKPQWLVHVGHLKTTGQFSSAPKQRQSSKAHQ